MIEAKHCEWIADLLTAELMQRTPPAHKGYERNITVKNEAYSGGTVEVVVRRDDVPFEIYINSGNISLTEEMLETAVHQSIRHIDATISQMHTLTSGRIVISAAMIPLLLSLEEGERKQWDLMARIFSRPIGWGKPQRMTPQKCGTTGPVSKIKWNTMADGRELGFRLGTRQILCDTFRLNTTPKITVNRDRLRIDEMEIPETIAIRSQGRPLESLIPIKGIELAETKIKNIESKRAGPEAMPIAIIDYKSKFITISDAYAMAAKIIGNQK